MEAAKKGFIKNNKSNSHNMKLKITSWTNTFNYDLLIRKTASSAGGQVMLCTVVVCVLHSLFFEFVPPDQSRFNIFLVCLFPAHFQVSPSGSGEERAARLPDWVERLLQDGQTRTHTSSSCSLPLSRLWLLWQYSCSPLTFSVCCVVRMWVVRTTTVTAGPLCCRLVISSNEWITCFRLSVCLSV